MTLACAVYKGGILQGTGTATGGSATIASYSAADDTISPSRRNVSIHITEAGVHAGRSFRTRCTADDGGGNLTLADAVPFVE